MAPRMETVELGLLFVAVRVYKESIKGKVAGAIVYFCLVHLYARSEARPFVFIRKAK